jgi:hypothetical protein
MWNHEMIGAYHVDGNKSIDATGRFPNSSVQEVGQASCLEDMFIIPISQAAALELEDLRELVQDYNLTDGPDLRIFCWGNSQYAAAKLYNLAFSIDEVPGIFQLIWKCKVTPQIKFFAWLILQDRLHTRIMLVRRHFNVHPDSLCVLCPHREEETIAHLFFQCDFAQACWDKLSIVWDLNDELYKVIERARQQSGLPLFMEIFLIAAWDLWKIRTGIFLMVYKQLLVDG